MDVLARGTRDAKHDPYAVPTEPLDYKREDDYDYPESGPDSSPDLNGPRLSAWGGCGDRLSGYNSMCKEQADGTSKSFEDASTEIDAPLPDLSFIYDDFYGPSDDFLTLIRAAWKVLTSNIDLVSWACCWVYGEDGDSLYWDIRANLVAEAVTFVPYYPGHMPSPAQAIIDALEWIYDTVVPFSDESNAIDRYLSKGILFAPWDPYGVGGYIFARLNSDQVVLIEENWATGDDGRRICAAIDMACLILHELVHIERWVWDVDYEGRTADEDCYETYLLANIFRWGIYQRYVRDLESHGACCAREMREDELFGSGHGRVLLDEDCSSGGDDGGGDDGGGDDGGGDDGGGGHPPEGLPPITIFHGPEIVWEEGPMIYVDGALTTIPV